MLQINYYKQWLKLVTHILEPSNSPEEANFCYLYSQSPSFSQYSEVGSLRVEMHIDSFAFTLRSIFTTTDQYIVNLLHHSFLTHEQDSKILKTTGPGWAQPKSNTSAIPPVGPSLAERGCRSSVFCGSDSSCGEGPGTLIPG